MLQSYQFPRSTLEELGMSSNAIAAFLDSLVQSNVEVHTFMMLRHGQVAAEGAWAPYQLESPHILFSLSKTVSSTAIGFAVQERLLSVEDLLISIFPEYVTPEIAANMAQLRVRHVLSMATGHDVETGKIQRLEPNGDWVKAFFDTPIVHPPGTHFLYNSGGSYMLSAIIRKLTGLTLDEYLRPRLFDPLGIDYALWDTCPRGTSEGASGLHMNADSIARLGQLYLQKGMWNGKRILSEAWVEEASSVHTDNNPKKDPVNNWNNGYGYQIWRNIYEGSYRGDGAFGQFCIVIPDKNAVIAITSGTDKMAKIADSVWEHLIPAMASEQPLAEEGAAASLRLQIAGLAYQPPRLHASSPEAALVTGRTYALEPNAKSVQAVSFAFDADACVFRLQDDRGMHEIRCGYGEWIMCETLATEDEWVKPVEVPWKIAASGTWHDEQTFVMTWRFVETTFTCTVECRFKEDRLNIHFTRNLTFDTYDFPPIEGRVTESIHK